MKKLTNKKGFTLIEMLVVIAIIAILVAIIIPVVTSATDKAAAATNAANMRSFKAEIVTSYLSNDGNVTVSDAGVVTIKSTTTGEGASAITTNSLKTPAMKEVKDVCEASDADVGVGGSSKWTCTYENGDFVLKYDGNTIDAFATLAGQKADT